MARVSPMLKAVSDAIGRACTPMRTICWKTCAELETRFSAQWRQKNPIKNLRV